VLRRHGEYKDIDLNLDLTKPLSLTVAQSWTTLFGSRGLEKVDSSVAKLILDVLQDVVNSASPEMKARAKSLRDTSSGMVQDLLPGIIDTAADILMERRKELSRGLSGHVKDGLCPGYTAAMLDKGTGSGNRQKVRFNPVVRRFCDPRLILVPSF
jgi:hypothetical protein